MKKIINDRNILHIDEETGEIVCRTENCSIILDGQKTEQEKIKEEYDRTHIKNFKKGEHFVKMWTDTIYMLSMNLKPKELQFAIGLSKYVSYEDCSLKIGYGRTSHYMNLTEISEVMDTEYTRTTRIVNSLIKKGVLGKFKTGNIKNKSITEVYIVNPFIYINGNNPDGEVYHYFINSGWNEYFHSIKDISE